MILERKAYTIYGLKQVRVVFDSFYSQHLLNTLIVYRASKRLGPLALDAFSPDHPVKQQLRSAYWQHLGHDQVTLLSL